MYRHIETDRPNIETILVSALLDWQRFFIARASPDDHTNRYKNFPSGTEFFIARLSRRPPFRDSAIKKKRCSPLTREPQGQGFGPSNYSPPKAGNFWNPPLV